MPLERVVPRALLERIDAIDERMGGKCDPRSSEVCGLCKHANVTAIQVCANFKMYMAPKKFPLLVFFSQTDNRIFLHSLV